MKKLKAKTIRELAKETVSQDRKYQVSRQCLLWIMQRIANDNTSDGYVPKYYQEVIDNQEFPN